MKRTIHFRRLLTALWGWWQRQLAKSANDPPYPLTYDEWEFIQEREHTRSLAAKAAASAKSHVDESGRLVGIDSGGGMQH